jgi:radical SAM superfamily enzyme YgiQ (UPF0313 family)
MKIGLIFPNQDRRYKTVHVGFGYLVSWARKQHKDLEFTLLDTRIASKKETRDFYNKNFDLIGISLYSPVYYEAIKVFNKIRNTNPDIPIVLGGPYVTTIKEEIFVHTPADYAVYGEGEISFSNLISHLKGEYDISQIDGLMYRGQNKEIITNPPRKRIENLDLIPMPAYDIFKMNKYPLHRMTATRGCPFSCVWCNSSSLWDHTYRQRNVDTVIDEIQFLIKNYGKKIFVFNDNSFNANLKWFEDFCNKLIERKVEILWSASFRADILTQDIAHKMKNAGCYNVAIGIESANNEMLKYINKGTNIEKISAGIKMLKNAGIEVMSQYVIGSPHETLETIKESVHYAKTSGADYTNFYSVLPYKGTAQWNYVEKYGTFFTKDIHHFHSINPRIVFETPEFPYADRLEALRIVKKNGYYSNQDKKNWMFDFAKDTGRKIQNLLPQSAGEKVYMLLKSIYKMKIVKTNNK